MGRTGRRRKRKRSSPQNSNNVDVISLQKWMRLKRTNLRISSFPETGRGVRSRKSVRAGDALIRLPLRALITPTTWCDAFSHITARELNHHARLSVFLMYESHLSEGSGYSQYINLLPSRYSTLFFCRPDEIEAMPGSMRDKVLEQIKTIRNQYKVVSSVYTSKKCNHCGSDLGEIFDYNLFTWAWFTVNTRSVYYKEGDCDTLALAPFLDMFNHSPNAETQMEIDHVNKLYIIKTLKDCKKNEEIFIKYGNHSSWKLILQYGFLVEGNPNDYVEFSFDEVIESAKSCNSEYGELDKGKYKLIKRNGLDTNLTKGRDEFSWSVNALMYVLTARDTNPSSITAKCYSGEYDPVERLQIQSISEALVKNKRESLLRDMKRVDCLSEGASESFCLVKKLLKMYVDLLQ